MSGGDRETRVERIRRAAEEALRKSARRVELESLLTRLLDACEGEGEHALFAHRHLAELLIEENPWRAALHLRSVAAEVRDDDVVHALMGLCQALLGNFRSAVSAYRRALAIAPRNPWYHHNLGHLLDVALSEPRAAVDHLKTAHRMEPLEHEITASLAHCLARIGQVEEALRLAEESIAAAPDNASHRDLLAWIESGPTEGSTPHGSMLGKKRPPESGGALGDEATGDEVVLALERGMREAGFSAGQVERALALWTDFHDGRSIRVVKPEVYAAAIEYAIALVNDMHGLVTKASVARRYGVARQSLSTRFDQIRDALALEPGDPRYATVP
jgi:tetratricopeptide (TPR) repeat protein